MTLNWYLQNAESHLHINIGLDIEWDRKDGFLNRIFFYMYEPKIKSLTICLRGPKSLLFGSNHCYLLLLSINYYYKQSLVSIFDLGLWCRDIGLTLIWILSLIYNLTFTFSSNMSLLSSYTNNFLSIMSWSDHLGMFTLKR
jgi:hypothetical protein